MIEDWSFLESLDFYINKNYFDDVEINFNSNTDSWRYRIKVLTIFKRSRILLKSISFRKFWQLFGSDTLNFLYFILLYRHRKELWRCFGFSISSKIFCFTFRLLLVYNSLTVTFGCCVFLIYSVFGLSVCGRLNKKTCRIKDDFLVADYWTLSVEFFTISWTESISIEMWVKVGS